jgi:saccharopine dehydrogenase-like NADP-dependent oxidoreductase
MKHPSPNLLILGGHGSTGRLIAQYLLQESEAQITLAGRHLAKAQQTAEQLNQRFGDERVSALHADAADPASLTEAFAGVDMVVVASSTAD